MLPEEVERMIRQLKDSSTEQESSIMMKCATELAVAANKSAMI